MGKYGNFSIQLQEIVFLRIGARLSRFKQALVLRFEFCQSSHSLNRLQDGLCA